MSGSPKERRCRIGILTLVLAGMLAACQADSRLGFSFGAGTRSLSGLGSLFSGPIWIARDLESIVRRLEREREQALTAAEQNGDLDRSPPTEAFPGWARCQEIALQARPEMLLVRMNMQALRAAIDILQGNRDRDYDDSIGRDFPNGFDARDWGEEILGRAGARGRQRKHLKRILSHEASEMRCLLTDLRDRINRDVVFAHHAWERSGNDKGRDPLAAAARRRAAWNLWVTMGCPR